MKKEALWLKGDAINKHASRKEAIKYYEEALDLEMETGDKLSQAGTIYEIGRHYSNTGNKEKAAEYHERALGMFAELGDKAGQARVLHSLASRSSVEEGISYYQRALDLFAEVGNKQWEASCHAGVNLLKRFGKRIEEAPPRGGLFSIAFRGAVCEIFERSSDALLYKGLSGTLGTSMHIDGYEFKDTFNASPFRFLPDGTKLLDFSPSVGDSWSMDVPSGGLDLMKITVTIESDSETVSVPAGEFPDCLKTRIVTSEEPEDCEENRCGVREFIYAPGVGLAKSTFVHRDGGIGIAQLTSYTVSDGNGDHFPLAIGNKWTYEWADREGGFRSEDIYEVTGMDNGHYYVSHYYHAARRKTVEYYEEALEHGEEMEDKPSQAHIMGEMARRHSNAGNKEKAVRYYRRALDIFTELGDKAGQAKILQGLGGQSLEAGSVKEGIVHYQRALDLFVEVGNKRWEASSHAGVNLLKQFGVQIEGALPEGGPPRIVFYGALSETFKRSSDAVMYHGFSGTLGTHGQIEGDDLKNTFNPSPFRFLPDGIKLLDFSLSVGDGWSTGVPSGGMEPMKITVTIESDSETISVLAGEFSNCLRTKIATSEEPEDCEKNRCGKREFIYAPGVGLVKATFVRRDGPIGVAQLASYTISGGSEDYFPLALGNKWTYEWSDEKGGFPSTDVYEVTGIDGGKCYVSHYYYALKEPED
jgi:tetratricopeptide (TPR) repeat protein